MKKIYKVTIEFEIPHDCVDIYDEIWCQVADIEKYGLEYEPDEDTHYGTFIGNGEAILEYCVDQGLDFVEIISEAKEVTNE